MQVFTFFCVESDGSVPRFDVLPCPDDQAARRRGLTARSCKRRLSGAL
jgi:hypothetical protein